MIAGLTKCASWSSFKSALVAAGTANRGLVPLSLSAEDRMDCVDSRLLETDILLGQIVELISIYTNSLE
jgi:hypothetical protein